MGYIELDEEILKSVERETGVTCKKIGNLISLEDVEPLFEDLLYEIDRLKEQLEDEKEQRENYYRPLTQRELGVE